MAMGKSAFLTELDAQLKDDDCVWVLRSPLIYFSKLAGRIYVPAGFETDFASVPRIPIAFTLYGNRAHREGVVHDFLFREDATPSVTYGVANSVFLEAMESRGKSWYVRWPMYLAVKLFSFPCFHKRKVSDQLTK